MPDDVKFQEARVEYSRPETPKIIQWVMKYSGGLIKNEKQAQYALLGFIILIIIVSLFLIFGGTGRNSDQIPTKIPASPEESPDIQK